MTSRIIKVIAGPDRKCFLAHADILSKSDHFRTQINGKWQDSKKNCIVLEDWEEDTVARLIAWLYTGDYKSPFPTIVEQPEKVESGDDTLREEWSTTGDKGSLPDCQAAFEGPTYQARQKYSRTEEQEYAHYLANSLMKVCNGESGADSEYKPTYEQELRAWFEHSASAKNDFHHYDYEQALLAHAKLYTLANYTLLPDLQALTKHRLQTILDTYSPQITNIVLLARYVYENSTKPESSKEPLRHLVSTFVGKIVFAGFSGEGADALLEEGGDFVIDVCAAARREMRKLKLDLHKTATCGCHGRRGPRGHQVLERVVLDGSPF